MVHRHDGKLLKNMDCRIIAIRRITEKWYIQSRGNHRPIAPMYEEKFNMKG